MTDTGRYHGTEEGSQPGREEGEAGYSWETIYGIVSSICEHFGRLIEHHGLYAHLYNDWGKLRSERFARLLFFGIADAYCRARDLSIGIEMQDEQLPVLFSIGHGYTRRIKVAVKYSSNPRTVSVFKNDFLGHSNEQFTVSNIFLVICTSESDNVIQELYRLRNRAAANRAGSAEVMVVDGRFSGEIRPQSSLELAEAHRPNTEIPCLDLERDQWYEYYFLCNNVFTGVRFTHTELGEAICVTPNTARRYYSEWLKSIDQERLKAEYGQG